jgi:HEAT repeat protein
VVLAQASVDWTKGALDSQDWAVRKAAAGVLADLPAKEAVPLLAKAIADEDPKVRLAASRSASKLKTPEAAKQVIDAVAAEKDPAVKEQQVLALGEMGQAEAKETLKAISEEPGRIGVIAAGSRIALGDTAAKDKLDAAVQAPTTELRLAAVQAASAANNKVVIPTLKIGVGDKIFDVQFAAAEGLSLYQAEKDAAVPVLTKALKSKDNGMVGRALAALTRLGQKVEEAKLSPDEMISSPDPQQRLAAVPVVKAMPVAERVPLLRRLVADPNEEVRRAGVDAIEGVVTDDTDQAIKLYKPLVNNADVVVRSKASGQLAKLKVAVAVNDAAKPAQPTEPAVAPPPPPVDDTLPRAQQAAAGATAAIEELKAASAALQKAIDEAADLKKNADERDDLEDAAGKLRSELKGKREALDAAMARLDAAEGELKGIATPSADAKKLIDAGLAALQGGRSGVGALGGKSDEARASLDKLGKSELAPLLVAARLALSSGDLAAAQANLSKASKALRDSGDKDPTLDFLYGQLYDARADNAADGPGKKKLQQQARDSFKRFLSARAGSARDKKQATDSVKRLEDELK